MTIQLANLIHQIRAAQSIEEEEHVITTELANIRTYIRECDSTMRPRVIAKLIYLNMMGRATSFGQLECLNLMTDDRFSYKRIGYLGASLLLDETTDITVLLTHTLEKDLQSKHKFVVSLALALLANIGSTELCRSLASHVQKVLEIDDPFLRKRAAMAVIRIIKKLPEFTETFQGSVHLLLNDPSHSVVLSGIGMVIQMLKAAPQLSESWSRFTPAFVKILRSLTASSRSYEASDPFLQVKVLEILALLKNPSEELDEALASIVSTADMKRSDGRAVLLQAVQTIVAVGKKQALRTLAFNQIGRLLSFRESNILYSALNVFSRVLYANRDILDRSGSDALALQRYKASIVKCLDNPDISIRRRALDVISALIDADNAEKLVPEILKYLHLADADFRMELVGRIFAAIQRFSPSEQWNFDSIIQILKESGDYVKSDVISSVCKVVSRSERMQAYAVSKLQPVLAESSTVQPLVQVASWILGEYGTKTTELEETLSQILVLPQTTRETKGYILTALAKLSARSGTSSITLDTLANECRDNDLDLQQRAGEFVQILTKTDIAESILAAAPPAEDEEEGTGKAGTEKSTEKAIHALENWMTEGEPEAPSATGNLLEELIELVTPGKAPEPSAKTGASLIDLLGPEVSSQPQQPAAPPASAPAPAPAKIPPGSVEVFNSGDCVIYFEIKPAQDNPNMIAIRATVVNKGNLPISNFLLEYAAQEGWNGRRDPPTGNSLEPRGQNVIHQVSYWKNDGMQTPGGIQFRPFALHIRVSYVYGSMPFKETRVIPPNVFSSSM